jgi:hypothetical protein
MSRAELAVRARQALATGGVAAAGAGYAAFALPLLIWLGNRPEFTAPWTALVAPFAMPALAVVALAAAIGAMCTPLEFRRTLALLAAIVLASWVQGTLLVWNYGKLDGGAIDWGGAPWRAVDVVAWLALPALAWWRPERAGRVLVRVAVIACLLQWAVVGARVASAGAPSPPAAAAQAQARLADFSPQRNVLHVVADGFQSDIFAELIAEPDAPALDGFVYFRDHLGAFPYTHLSVPALVGGEVYDNAEPLPSFMARNLGPGSILHAARGAGFDVEIGVPAGALAALYARAGDARLVPIPTRLHVSAWRSQRDESLLLADLTLFRLAPHWLKRAVHADEKWFFQRRYGRRAVPGRAFMVHNAFLRGVARGMTATRPRPTYKLLHLMLSHRPWVARPDCTHAGSGRSGRDAVRDQARCSLRSLAAVFESMRRLGIYDSAMIVVMGDHGSFADATAARRDGIASRATMGQARPLLLVKPPHAQGPLSVSEATTWIVDTPATIAAAAGIPGRFPGRNALAAPVDPSRERRYLEYAYWPDEWDAEHVPALYEYVVRGRGDDAGAWRVGRTLGPGGGVASPR